MSEKQAAYAERQKERGMKKVCVWVDEEGEEKVKAIAAEARQRKKPPACEACGK